MELAPGTFVTPTVCLVRLLGEGGMGSVWVADHTALDTQVAVKFVTPELLAQDSSILERFNREASLSAQIKSPYVVQTFDHGVMDDGRPYIVMELLEGSSLAETMAAGTLSLDEISLIITQASKALSKAHSLGIVHRDIKPDNLFLTRQDDEVFLKVLDFGIAKQTGLPKASAVTSTGMMVGTPEYMSPEQVLSAKAVDFRADLWALAVVAYHCLTGGVPFTGETLGSLCVAIASANFVPPSQHRAGLPPEVDAWFVRGLAKDPEERFESSKQLAATFKAALVGQATASGSGDWSGPYPKVSVPLARPALPSDAAALQLAHSAAAVPANSGAASPVRTFAGTTMDPGVPKRRTLAALGVGALLVGLGGAALLFFAEADAEVAHPEGTASPAAAPPAPIAGPTAEVTIRPSATATGSPQGVASSAPHQASSQHPEHDHPPLPSSATVPRPFVPSHTASPHVAPQPPAPAPRVPDDKYGF